MTTVMVTSAGRRRYVLEELAKSGRPGDNVIAADMNPLAPALSARGVHPLVIEGESLAHRSEAILRIVEREQVDALLSLHDYEAIELSKRGAHFQSLGCTFIGPTVEASQLTLDKLALAKHLSSFGGSLTPQTYSDLEELNDAAGAATQWVVKDRWGSGSSGLAFVDASGVVNFAERLPSETWVAQPKTEGVEFNVDMFIDADGDIAGASVKRKWAMRGGETDSATVLLNPPVEVLKAAKQSIAGLHITGNVDVDVILQESGRAVVLDVNPRFGGGFAFSALAGYQAAKAIWQLARREPVTPLSPAREITASKYVAVTEVASL